MNENKMPVFGCFCKNKNGDWYIYDLSGNIRAKLCPTHHVQLAGEIMKQITLEVFVPEQKSEKGDL